jgi:hypothetical protein
MQPPMRGVMLFFIQFFVKKHHEVISICAGVDTESCPCGQCAGGNPAGLLFWHIEVDEKWIFFTKEQLQCA